MLPFVIAFSPLLQALVAVRMCTQVKLATRQKPLNIKHNPFSNDTEIQQPILVNLFFAYYTSA
jgi:hypothetical protein